MAKYLLAVAVVSVMVAVLGTEEVTTCESSEEYTVCYEKHGLKVELGADQDLVTVQVSTTGFTGGVGYLALGVNTEGAMPGSSIVACVRDSGGDVTLHPSKALTRATPVDLTADEVGLTDTLIGTLDGDTFTCQFQWPNAAGVEFLSMVSDSEDRCLVMARGEVDDEGGLLYHNDNRVPDLGCIEPGHLQGPLEADDPEAPDEDDTDDEEDDKSSAAGLHGTDSLLLLAGLLLAARLV